ncbi:MAG: hypothetical protein HYT71_01135 [Candidatus Aenigmarchaeota archaeon]|nr:hypothetical protein [Candidatus Aenigmarchaeota archaeon]
MVEFTGFDMVFLKILGTILFVLGLFMGAFFPARDFETKYRFIGVLVPGTMIIIGLYLWTVQ